MNAEVSINGTLNFCAHSTPSKPTDLPRDNALIGQVDFVGDQQDLDVLRRQVLDLAHPLVDRLEAVLVVGAVDDHDAVGAC